MDSIIGWDPRLNRGRVRSWEEGLGWECAPLYQQTWVWFPLHVKQLTACNLHSRGYDAVWPPWAPTHMCIYSHRCTYIPMANNKSLDILKRKWLEHKPSVSARWLWVPWEQTPPAAVTMMSPVGRPVAGAVSQNKPFFPKMVFFQVFCSNIRKSNFSCLWNRGLKHFVECHGC